MLLKILYFSIKVKDDLEKHVVKKTTDVIVLPLKMISDKCSFNKIHSITDFGEHCEGRPIIAKRE
jgi:hypothetical protein